MRDDDRERVDAFSGPGCVCTRAWQVDTVNCLKKKNSRQTCFLNFSNVSSAFSLTSLASNGAVHVRGGVIKFRLVVDNDTTVHAVHTYTVAFSP